MGRLLREKEMAPYIRGVGANWNVCNVSNTNKIAKLSNSYRS